jgi:mRNA interferase MazF
VSAGAPRAPLASGDVVLVRFPFTDLSGQKVRPALIVGRSRGDDLILAFMTSRLAPADARVDLLLQPGDPEFPAMGLKAAALIRLDKLATLHRGLIRRRLGRIGVQTRQAVAGGLRFVLGL